MTTVTCDDAAPPSSSTTSRPGRCANGPRRTSGPTCCCASTTAPTAASWSGGCTGWSSPAGVAPTRPRDTSITVAFTYHGLQALGVPQASLDSFAPEFREGMAARAAVLGDVGESSPEHWEKPAGHPRRARRHRRALPRRRAVLQAVAEQGACAQHELAGRRAGLAPGLLPAADRPDLVRLQGRHRPARRRGQRPAPVEPEGAAAQGRRDHPRLPRRDRRAAADADARTCSAATARTWSSASCTPGSPPTASTCATGPPTGPRRSCSARRWSDAGRAGPRSHSLPTRDDPGARRRPDAQQRLRVRRRPPGLQVPGRRPRPTREPARRLRPRRQRRRPAAPDDPARHQLRPDAARRRARGRRRRPGHHLRLRRGAPATAVRVRQDPVAQRRHLHRRPGREGPAGGAERRDRQLHHPAAPDPPAAAGPAAVRRHPRRRVLLRPRPAGDAAGWRSSSHDPPRPEDAERTPWQTSSTGTDRWDALDFGPPAARRRGDRAAGARSTTAPTAASP